MDNSLEIGLPEYIRKGIIESIEQANRGEFISYDEVKQKASALLKNETQNNPHSEKVDVNK